MDSKTTQDLIDAMTVTLSKLGKTEFQVRGINVSPLGENPEYKIFLISSNRVICTITPDPDYPTILVFDTSNEISGIPEDLFANTDSLFLIKRRENQDFALPQILPRTEIPKPLRSVRMPANAPWFCRRKRRDSVCRHT